MKALRYCWAEVRHYDGMTLLCVANCKAPISRVEAQAMRADRVVELPKAAAWWFRNSKLLSLVQRAVQRVSEERLEEVLGLLREGFCVT